MYQLRQLIPISNINNWCWSMQLKINWQVTVAQCNSNCSRIGIFSVYIIGVRLSDCLLTRLQPFATVQSCTVSLSRTVSSLLSHPIYILLLDVLSGQLLLWQSLYMITEHCAVGVIITGARTHATLLSENDVWMTWVPDSDPIWEHSGVLKVLILLPNSILMVWGQLGFRDLNLQIYVGGSLMLDSLLPWPKIVSLLWKVVSGMLPCMLKAVAQQACCRLKCWFQVHCDFNINLRWVVFHWLFGQHHSQYFWKPGCLTRLSQWTYTVVATLLNI